MEFFSRSNYPETIPCPECSKEKDLFDIEIDKETGKKELVKIGQTNFYEKIQASKENTLVYNILDRFSKGDVTVLQQRQGQYGDFTKTPTTLAEAQQSLINAERMFNQLPLEVRKEFNHSVSEFLASIDNGSYDDKVKKFNVPEAELPKVDINVEKSSIDALNSKLEQLNTQLNELKGEVKVNE